MFITDKKVQKKHSPFVISVFFHNKGFDYRNQSSILHVEILKNLFPDKLKTDYPPSVAYSLGKATRNKILNCKEIVSSNDTNDDIRYGTDIVECDCQQHKNFVDENHGHVLTGELKIIPNSKLRNRDWFSLKHRTNSFNKTQSNSERVC